MTKCAIGIDFGIANSRVAICRNNTVEIIENECGFRVTPSVVTFTEEGYLVGEEAVDQAHRYGLKATVFEVRRLIGQKFDDPQVQADIRNFTYNIFNDLGTPKIRIPCRNGEPREYYPEEISAYILNHMKSIAEKHLKAKVTRAVVTVPAYFNDSQRRATKDAAIKAGFKFVNVINEPTAAALAFNHKFSKSYKRNIVVYDFGRYTFDVSIVTVGRGSCDIKATKGDSQLGGTDIDTNLINFVRQDFKAVYGKELGRQYWTQDRIKNICEINKRRLSGSTLNTNIELYHLLVGDYDYTDYTKALSRERFEELNQKYFDRTVQIVDDCLKDSGIRKSDIDEVVLVGGSSRIPKIQKMLKEDFGENKINNGMNPEEAIAYGAAIHAKNIAGDKEEVHDVTLSSQEDKLLKQITIHSDIEEKSSGEDKELQELKELFVGQDCSFGQFRAALLRMKEDVHRLSTALQKERAQVAAKTEEVICLHKFLEKERKVKKELDRSLIAEVNKNKRLQGELKMKSANREKQDLKNGFEEV